MDVYVLVKTVPPVPPSITQLSNYLHIQKKGAKCKPFSTKCTVHTYTCLTTKNFFLFTRKYKISVTKVVNVLEMLDLMENKLKTFALRTRCPTQRSGVWSMSLYISATSSVYSKANGYNFVTMYSREKIIIEFVPRRTSQSTFEHHFSIVRLHLIAFLTPTLALTGKLFLKFYQFLSIKREKCLERYSMPNLTEKLSFLSNNFVLGRIQFSSNFFTPKQQTIYYELYLDFFSIDL